MHVLIVDKTRIPVQKYGGTERVIWWLGKQLVNMGHKVSYLVAAGSYCNFAQVYIFNPNIPFNKQIPENIDVVHLNCIVNETPNIPYIRTVHGNANENKPIDINAVFVSANHAARFGSTSFVHNGIDPDDYGDPGLNKERNYFHFLGDAAWRIKNVRGAIKIAQSAKIPLRVIGGVRFNFNQGIRLTFDPRIQFHGMIGGAEKNEILKHSKGLIFPVLWHEPFGISIVESLYFGCPVFGTPYGSLPEIVNADLGYLSNSTTELVDAIKHVDSYSKKYCHEYVMNHFSSKQMAQNYVEKYEMVLNGSHLNYTIPILKEEQIAKFLPFEK